MELIKKVYIIRALTNMHVGSGDSDYGLVDKNVQRDVLTGYPCINSSSLKGALKNKAESINWDNGKKKEIKNFFGDLTQGKFKFFQGNLLFIPARSDKAPYFLVTCLKILEEFKEICGLLGNVNRGISDEKLKEITNELSGKDGIILNSKNKDLEGLEVEEIQITNSNINMPEARDEIFNKEFVILSNEKFKELVGNLPIIARNHLNNGESKNLWYEEIVPRESMFYFGIDMGIEDNSIKLFDEIIKDLVYIGGNVTVGYGACQIKELKG